MPNRTAVSAPRSAIWSRVAAGKVAAADRQLKASLLEALSPSANRVVWGGAATGRPPARRRAPPSGRPRGRARAPRRAGGRL
ncbi:hypothetical protein [Nonomuraea salmonea]|uniref:hypothetical protein n=1 Tax=Nonomuraea salmonea TaxID=46181 RepID=UPI0031EB94AB